MTEEYAKCPHCKKDLEFLEYKIVKIYTGIVDYNGDTESDDDCDPINNQTYTAYCPHHDCRKAILNIDSDDEAKDWLNDNIEEAK